MDILGVRINNFSKQEIFNKIFEFLNEEKFHQIATINPEFILNAQKDEQFRNILNSCDLNVADGIGISFAFWWLKEKLKCRIAGIDLMQEILKIANEKKMKIYLATNGKGLSDFEETKDAILKKYPDLEINGANICCHSGLDPESIEILKQVQNEKCEIVFCNFGAPFQEKFLSGRKCDKIKLAIGVGGSFDYLTGKLKRAPKWMQIFGIEWFWRFMLQPKRIKRILNAVIVFPIKLIFYKK